MTKLSKNNRLIISFGIILASLGITYAPIPGVKETMTIVGGTELKEPLQELETKFEQTHPNINLEFEFQGSQDIVNKYIDNKNDFIPTVIIPANHIVLDELSSRWQAQNDSEPFYGQPQPIAKTMLVGIAWQERGEILFPNNQFQWSTIERAMQQRNWSKIGGKTDWGSFDFIMTDPTRSNSGQLTLSLWTQTNSNSLNNPQTETLVSLIKRSVYQPPRSTDILLQEFISRGANDGDIATVYESIALYRWSQAKTTQGKPYQIYYPNPTIETTATAAIVRRDVDRSTAKAAQKFVTFLTETPQQELFVKYGFRPASANIDLASVTNSPWSKNIPGAMVKPKIQIEQPPSSREIAEIQRIWSRAN